MQYFYNRLYILQRDTSEFIFLPGRGPTPNNHNKNSINHLSTKKKNPRVNKKKLNKKKSKQNPIYFFKHVYWKKPPSSNFSNRIEPIKTKNYEFVSRK